MVGTRNQKDVSDAGAFQFARSADAVYGELEGGGGKGRGSDLALFFPLSLADNFPGTEGFSPPGPLLAPSGTDIKGKAHWLRVCGSSSAPPLASHETPGPCGLLVGEHGKLTHRLAQSASAHLLAGRSRFLGQEP